MANTTSEPANGRNPNLSSSELSLRDISNIKILLGKNIKRLRIEHKWSQEELSKKSGIHRNHIGNIESGMANPTIEIIAKVAAVFGTKTADLLVPYVRKRTRPRVSADAGKD